MTFDLNTLTTDYAPETLPTPTLHREFPEIIDNTAREQFFTCPRKFELSSINQVTPARKSIHLHAGGAYAAGLEALRRAYYERNLPAKSALEVGVYELIRFYGDYEPLEGDVKTCERMVGALVSYTEQYPLEQDTIRPYMFAENHAAVEFTFAIPIDVLHPVTRNPILYAGRFDMLAERAGIRYGLDDKTTSQLGPTWGKQWELNSQFTGYCWAARTLDLPVAGFIIRGQSILKTTYGHAQAITYRPDWAIDRWYKQLCHDVGRAILCWRTNSFDYALGATCSAYSGCEFRQLCLHPQPETQIPGNYIQRHWNPTQKDPEAPEAPR